MPGSDSEKAAVKAGFTTTEVFPLLLFAVAGMLVFPSANDLLTLFVALEVFSLPLYLMCALARRKRLMSQEAAVKYFLLGAFASAFTLFGIALLYGYAGSVSYATIAQVVDGNVTNVDPASRAPWATTRSSSSVPRWSSWACCSRWVRCPSHVDPDVYQARRPR